MKHHLLILGSLREFVQLIQLAKSHDIYTVVCDGYHDSIGKQYADKAYDIPPGNIDEIVELCKKEKIDGIITSFSDYLFECMVKIAAKANLKCYFYPEKLDLYRNKAAMKQMLDSLGICNAKSAIIEKNFIEKDLAQLQFPLVSKPLDKYGSRGVMILHNVEEIRQYFDLICETSDIKKVLLEEYHTGYEFNMMSWILNGKVHVLSIADREKTSVSEHEIPISTRNVYPSRFLSDVYDEAKSILQKVADFTGQTDGILSMQFFWKPGEPICVCEVAGRFLGYEHELIEYCSGLAVEELLLAYLYDEKKLSSLLENYSPFFHKHAAVLYFHGKNGMTVETQTAASNLSLLSRVKDYWQFYHSGETVIPHGPNPYVLRYYLCDDSREKIDALTEYIFQNAAVTDIHGESVIYPNKMTAYPQTP